MQALQERPLLGSGPGTFVVDYAKYRSADVNASQFWNIRFDRGSSHVLTSLASTGYLGTLTWVILVLYLLVISVRSLLRADEKTWHVMVGVFAAWFLLVMARVFYSSTMTLEVMFWMSMGLLVIVTHKEWHSVTFEHSPRAAMVLSFLFILSGVMALSGFFIQGQRHLSEVHYARAIANDRVQGDVDETLTSLGKASALNRNNSGIVRNAALAIVAKVNIMLNEPITIERNDGESDADYQKRQTEAGQALLRKAMLLTADAVNTAKLATEIDPANVANWTTLASVYQSLMGITEDADVWAVTTYEKAITLEPANPALRTELGKVYVWQADRQAGVAAAEGVTEEAAAEATALKDDLLQKAVDVFTKATDLKRDYAPAYYHQGLAYERQGKTEEAISRLEAVATLSPQDVGVGFQLALLYFQNDQKDAAIALLESVIRLSPDYSNALWYLGAMYEDKGDIVKAIEMITKVKELNPDNELVAQKLSELAVKAVQPAAEGVDGLPAPVEEVAGAQGEAVVQP